MTSKHTQLPWTLGRIRQEDEDYWIKEVCTHDGYCMFRCNEEDADLIVRAVNNHDALLAACKTSLGAYDALKCVGASKHLPGYDGCLADLLDVIRKAEEPHA